MIFRRGLYKIDCERLTFINTRGWIRYYDKHADQNWRLELYLLTKSHRFRIPFLPTLFCPRCPQAGLSMRFSRVLKIKGWVAWSSGNRIRPTQFDVETELGKMNWKNDANKMPSGKFCPHLFNFSSSPSTSGLIKLRDHLYHLNLQRKISWSSRNFTRDFTHLQLGPHHFLQVLHVELHHILHHLYRPLPHQSKVLVLVHQFEIVLDFESPDDFNTTKFILFILDKSKNLGQNCSELSWLRS